MHTRKSGAQLAASRLRPHWFLRHWGRLGPTARDAVLAAAVAMLVFAGALLGPETAPPVVLAALSAGVSAPLVLRRRLPVTTALLCMAVATIGLWVPGWPGKFVAIGSFGSAAYHGRRAWPMFVLSAAWFAGFVVATAGHPMTAGPVVGLALAGLAPVAIGHALRLYREHTEQTARLRQAEADLIVSEERNRIAREMHDAVGHHLTAVRMQASAARHVIAESPPTASRALDTITELSSTALGDVRVLLRTLHDGKQTCRAALSDVDILAERLSTDGCRITVSWEGPDVELPALVEHGGFRLTQEAISNAFRHSGAGTIQVRIARERRAVRIVVEDDGRADPPGTHPEGSGIRGMRERAQLLGGTLSVEPREPHGWRVAATLPTERMYR